METDDRAKSGVRLSDKRGSPKDRWAEEFKKSVQEKAEAAPTASTTPNNGKKRARGTEGALNTCTSRGHIG